MNSRRLTLLLLVGAISIWPTATQAVTQSVAPPPAPRNIILMIGDGMGFEQVKAASLFSSGTEKSLGFQSLPYTASMTTDSASIGVTDSAAASTALATGKKVNNGIISVALPGDQTELKTLLEHFQTLCKRTGLVTTTEMTHATPAAFAAHTRNRNNYEGIAQDFLKTKPNLLFGGGLSELLTNPARANGYTILENRDQLSSLDPHSIEYALGAFGEGHMAYEYDFLVGRTNFYEIFPHLSEMTSAALNLLSAGEGGFFLMVEGGRIDHTAHGNNLERTIFETLEFAKAADVAIQWVQDHPDTLLIVTADHETGGLTVVSNKGLGEIPEVTWGTGDHTRTPVPVYATGVNAEFVTGRLDNTDIYKIISKNSPSPEVACNTETEEPTDRRVLIYTGFGLSAILILSLFLFLLYRSFAARPYQPRF